MAGRAEEIQPVEIQRPDGQKSQTCDRGAAVTVLTVGGDYEVGTATDQTSTGGYGDRNNGCCTAMCWQGETLT
ncbi:hypothetical protein M8J76_011785 [Diaphorina citri]|nr:hypothetical protein M8J76_012946 [Diaphorina citri]KAI5741247.1 hypothetical protein M8J76_011785 [Diaphorina citri]